MGRIYKIGKNFHLLFICGVFSVYITRLITDNILYMINRSYILEMMKLWRKNLHKQNQTQNL